MDPEFGTDPGRGGTGVPRRRAPGGPGHDHARWPAAPHPDLLQPGPGSSDPLHADRRQAKTDLGSAGARARPGHLGGFAGHHPRRSLGRGLDAARLATGGGSRDGTGGRGARSTGRRAPAPGRDRRAPGALPAVRRPRARGPAAHPRRVRTGHELGADALRRSVVAVPGGRGVQRSGPSSISTPNVSSNRLDAAAISAMAPSKAAALRADGVR